MALGASRRRLLTEVIVELALLGAASLVFVTVAQTLLGRVVSSLPLSSSLSVPVTIDASAQVVGAQAIALLLLLLVSLAGSLPWLGGGDASAALQSVGRSDRRVGHTFGRSVVVLGQVSCSVLLLVCSLLFSKAVANERGIDLGFDSDDVILAHLPFNLTQRPPAERFQLLEEAARTLDDQPWTASVAVSSRPPIDDLATLGRIEALGLDAESVTVNQMHVSSSYFDTMSISVIGRYPDSGLAGRQQVVVSDSLAMALWGDGTSPIGDAVIVPAFEDGAVTRRRFEVVGVAADTNYTALHEDRPLIVYLPAESYRAAPEYMLARVGSGAREGALRLATLFGTTYSDVPVRVQTLETHLERWTAPARALARTTALFAILAWATTLSGLYAFSAFVETQRLRETGIRMAIGATPRRIFLESVRRNGTLGVQGTCIGVLLALWAGRLLSGSLYGLSPVEFDTLLLGGVAALGVTLLSTLVPARRAAFDTPRQLLQ